MFSHSVVVASVLASILPTQQIQRTDFDLEIEAHLNGVMNSLYVTDRKKEQIKKGYEDDTDMCAFERHYHVRMAQRTNKLFRVCTAILELQR